MHGHVKPQYKYSFIHFIFFLVQTRNIPYFSDQSTLLAVHAQGLQLGNVAHNLFEKV